MQGDSKAAAAGVGLAATAVAATAVAGAPIFLAAASVTALLTTLATQAQGAKDHIDGLREHYKSFPKKLEFLYERVMALLGEINKAKQLNPPPQIQQRHEEQLKQVFDSVMTYASKERSRRKIFSSYKRIDEEYVSLNKKLDSAMGQLGFSLDIDRDRYLREMQADAQAFRKQVMEKLDALTPAAEQKAGDNGSGEHKVCGDGDDSNSEEAHQQDDENVLTRDELTALSDQLASYMQEIQKSLGEFRDTSVRVSMAIAQANAGLTPPQYDFSRYTQPLKDKWANPTVRLFGGEEVPVGQLYVEEQLRLVVREDAQVSDEEGQSTPQENTASKFFNMKVEGERQVPVSFEELFSQADDAKYVNCVAGAGYGKTVQAKELLRLWSAGNLGDKVKWMFHFPLKQVALAFDRGRHPSFADIMHECFFRDNPAMTASPEEIAAFCQFIKEHPEQALFVVEGVDEVDHPIVQKILSSITNAFVTGRSLVAKSHAAALVNIGKFDHEQRNKFIENLFSNLPLISGRSAEDLIEWLKDPAQEAKVGKVCEVPLLLQILCELWRDPDVTLFDEENFSIYSLFEVLTRKIMMKFLEQKQEEYQITFSQTRVAERDVLMRPDRGLGGLRHFAELIAYESYREGNIAVVGDGLINATITRYPDCFNPPHITVDKLIQLGFFESVAVEGQGGEAYAFLHMKLREHMAGKVLAERLSSADKAVANDAKTYIEENKFNPEFMPVLESAAAALTGNVEVLDMFFETLLTGKRDYIGYIEFKTLLVCADACGWPQGLSVRENILSELADCLTNFVEKVVFAGEVGLLADSCAKLLRTSDFAFDHVKHQQLQGGQQMFVDIANAQFSVIFEAFNVDVEGENIDLKVVQQFLRSWMLLVRLPQLEKSLSDIYAGLCQLQLPPNAQYRFHFTCTKIIVEELARDHGEQQSMLSFMEVVAVGVAGGVHDEIWGYVWKEMQVFVPASEFNQVLERMGEWLLDFDSRNINALAQGEFGSKVVFPKKHAREVFEKAKGWMRGLLDAALTQQSNTHSNISARLVLVIRIIDGLGMPSEDQLGFQSLLNEFFASQGVDVASKAIVWKRVLACPSLPQCSDDDGAHFLDDMVATLEEAKKAVKAISKVDILGSHISSADRGASDIYQLLENFAVGDVNEPQKQALLKQHKHSFGSVLADRIMKGINAAPKEAFVVEQQQEITDGVDALRSSENVNQQQLADLLDTSIEAVQAGEFFQDKAVRFTGDEWRQVINELSQHENNYLRVLARQILLQFHPNDFLESHGLAYTTNARQLGEYRKLHQLVVGSKAVMSEEIPALFDAILNAPEGAPFGDLPNRLRLAPDAGLAFLQKFLEFYDALEEHKRARLLLDKKLLQQLVIQPEQEADVRNILLALFDKNPVIPIDFMEVNSFSKAGCLSLVRWVTAINWWPKQLVRLAEIINANPDYFSALIACYGDTGMNEQLQCRVLFLRFASAPETVICRVPNEETLYWHEAGKRCEEVCVNPSMLEAHLREASYLPQVELPMWKRAMRAVDVLTDFFAFGSRVPPTSTATLTR